MAKTSRTRQLTVLTALAAASIFLTGCSPEAPATLPSSSASSTPVAPKPTATAEPTGTKPPLTGLVLTTEGLGELQFGTAPPTDNPATDLVTHDPEGCAGTGAPSNDLWLANYPASDEGSGLTAPFAVGVTGGVLTRVDVHTTDIITDLGLNLGSTIDAVLGTYPGGPDEVYNHADVSDVYVFAGEAGKLMFEIAVDRVPGYWTADEVNTVVFLSAVSLDTPTYGVAATDNTVGICTVS